MPCVVCWCYVVHTTSKQQGKATRLLCSYPQVVDGLVDNSISVDFVVDKFGDGVGRYKTFARTLPLKTPIIIKHFIMQKCVFYAILV